MHIPYFSGIGRQWKTISSSLWYKTGLIPGLRPANERRCYFVTKSLIGGPKPSISPVKPLSCSLCNEISSAVQIPNKYPSRYIHSTAIGGIKLIAKLALPAPSRPICHFHAYKLLSNGGWAIELATKKTSHHANNQFLFNLLCPHHALSHGHGQSTQSQFSSVRNGHEIALFIQIDRSQTSTWSLSHARIITRHYESDPAWRTIQLFQHIGQSLFLAELSKTEEIPSPVAVWYSNIEDKEGDFPWNSTSF